MWDMKIRHDEGRRRFVADVDGGEAYLSYEPAGTGRLDFESTFVPPAARGHGVGARLVMTGFAFARSEGCRVIPTCSFVRRVVEDHPEYEALIEG